ncbi:MAG: hypothetical protein B6D41_14240 [Chloroflexi bacterium UTCFX4]|nr:MAG: hypothetical protein B6D41_14240 [Chloroflexi bacterium UTCFX4]
MHVFDSACDLLAAMLDTEIAVAAQSAQKRFARLDFNFFCFVIYRERKIMDDTASAISGFARIDFTRLGRRN